MPKIYVASRASIPERPAMWRSLRDDQGWQIVSSWIDEADPGQTDDWSELWSRIEGEIDSSDGLILYAKGSDFPLKGAFIEVGMALGKRKPVAIVLEDCVIEERSMRPVGSWIAHPMCQSFASVFEAKDWLAEFIKLKS